MGRISSLTNTDTHRYCVSTAGQWEHMTASDKCTNLIKYVLLCKSHPHRTFAASASEWWEGAHVTQTCNRSILPVQKSGRGNIGGGLN